MAVSMQSTESGGVVNFSVGDTLTVNGKIVAQGLVTPDAGVRYTDYKNHIYTVPSRVYKKWDVPCCTENHFT